MSFSDTHTSTNVHGQRTVFVVLPAYNEGPTIGRLFDHINNALSEVSIVYHVVLVDDGSEDNTLTVAKKYASHMPITIERHDVNKGLGATIRDGLARAVTLASDSDVIITMDADDTHSPGLILRMVEMIREGHDVVIASRFQPGSRVIGVPPHRELLSLCASWLFRLVLPIRGVRDFTCGFRAYRAEVLRNAIAQYGERFVDRDGFECMVDILLKLRSMNLVFGEAPFILRYDHKDGHTKMNVGRTIRNSLLLVLKRRLGR
jgi:dolichol-phosphate mannosyltransferase